MTEYKIQKPVIADASSIAGLINHFAEKRIMLPRAVADVWERIRDFTICELKGRVIGCVALHVFSAVERAFDACGSEGDIVLIFKASNACPECIHKKRN